MALAAIRWGFAGNLKQSLYWALASGINAIVTFLPD
jgi:hypothetical protein